MIETVKPSSEIVLCGINSRYSHTSFGIRYLRANLHKYRNQSVIQEYYIKKSPEEIAEGLLSVSPQIIGIGVYIWNIPVVTKVIDEIKKRAPRVLIVLGGPEVSHLAENQRVVEKADFVIQGEADFLFRDLISNYFEKRELPQKKILKGELPNIATIRLPYDEYTDEDVAHRRIYVEASRGCPFKCEYCISSLDELVRNFPLEPFLDAMQTLIDRGARQFKFLDRTFNLSIKISTQILRFFLDRVHLGLFLHFEMIPDRLPEELKELIRQFPEGSLQFEVGVQTWNPQVAKNVSRRQDYQKIVENFQFLKHETKVHMHADLIVGLPGEDFESFATGFDALLALDPDDIQVGILKRLKGAPIVRHDQEYQMAYSQDPPFELISNRDLSAEQMRKLKIFSEFWERIRNSGRYPLLFKGLKESRQQSFHLFFDLFLELHDKFNRTHSIPLSDLDQGLREVLANRGLVFSFRDGSV